VREILDEFMKKQITSSFVLDRKNKTTNLPVTAQDIIDLLALGPDVFGIFVYLCTQSYRNNFNASVMSIAIHVNMDKSKISRIIQKLKDHSWLHIEKDQAARMTLYRIWLGKHCAHKAKTREQQQQHNSKTGEIL
jgi:DNA-binding MarR family transcriptional regulator